MNELISRQAAIDALEREKSLVERPITETRWFDFGLGRAQDVLRKLPSAQPEIIRCKDCKFWTHIKRTNRYWCKTDDGLYDLNPSPDDFCSKAERRTDGSNMQDK